MNIRRQVERRLIQATMVGFTFAVIAACSSDDDDNPATPTADASPDALPPNDASGTQDTSQAQQDAAPDASTPGDSGGACFNVADAGASCNNLTNIGTNVALTTTTSAIPVGTNPTIPDGRYVLTEFKAYAGSPATAANTMPLNQTIVICGKTAQVSGDDVGAPHYNKTFLFQANGLPKDNPPACTDQVPDGELGTTSLSVGTNSFTLYSSSLVVGVTYTKM